MAKNSEYEIIKKGYTKDSFTRKHLVDLALCSDDPIYFIQNFIKVQHPTKGSIPLILYDYQVDMVRAFHEHRFVVGLTARQMGKSLFYTTSINKNGEDMLVGDLVQPNLSIREKVVTWLESALVKLAKS